METTILYGKPVADSIFNQVRRRIEELKKKGITPKLTVILVGDDPASKVYVSKKHATCLELGMLSETIILPAATTRNELAQYIEHLNNDFQNHGILVQSPLPAHIDEDMVVNSIDPGKDVDCFHPENVGKLVMGSPRFIPCTPGGIVDLLKFYSIKTSGKHVVILGRSNIVGKPMANLIVQKNSYGNAAVTVLHSHVPDLKKFTKSADIIIAAIGKPHFVNGEMITAGVTIIDVGINRIEAQTKSGYRLTGDVDFEGVLGKAGAITPVPGGVGPLTIAALMKNTVHAAAFQNGLDDNTF